jgi:2-oxo-4-hydroxy-4-carboxy-5-ureidoimidazoline decarboxylase
MTLHDLNTMDQRKLRELLMECSGCNGWSKIMLIHFPAEDLVDLLENAEDAWYECSEEEWKESFLRNAESGENAGSDEPGFPESKKNYLEKFGYPFILFRNNITPGEAGAQIQSRLQNNTATEIRIAADETMKIIRHRLEQLVD